MPVRLAIVVLILGGGTVLAAKLLPVWQESKNTTLEGEKKDSERKMKERGEAIAAEVKKLQESGDTTGAEKKEEEGRKELQETREKDSKRAQEIDKEIEDRGRELDLAAMKRLKLKLGGAAALALGLLILAFAGGDAERAVAIFGAAVILPMLF